LPSLMRCIVSCLSQGLSFSAHASRGAWGERTRGKSVPLKDGGGTSGQGARPEDLRGRPETTWPERGERAEKA